MDKLRCWLRIRSTFGLDQQMMSKMLPGSHVRQHSEFEGPDNPLQFGAIIGTHLGDDEFQSRRIQHLSSALTKYTQLQFIKFRLSLSLTKSVT
jgi:hypothetical protein